MRVETALVCLSLAITPAFGGDVPYAEPSSTRLGTSSDAYFSSLADVMGLTQLRHIKLWYAAQAQNWQLTGFELSKIRDTFARAAMFYQNLPLDYVISVREPLDVMQKATEARDSKKFAKGFAGLTTACNSCHRAAGVGFIVIQTPTTSPFSDQKFD